MNRYKITTICTRGTGIGESYILEAHSAADALTIAEFKTKHSLRVHETTREMVPATRVYSIECVESE